MLGKEEQISLAMLIRFKEHVWSLKKARSGKVDFRCILLWLSRNNLVRSESKLRNTKTKQIVSHAYRFPGDNFWNNAHFWVRNYVNLPRVKIYQIKFCGDCVKLKQHMCSGLTFICAVSFTRLFPPSSSMKYDFILLHWIKYIIAHRLVHSTDLCIKVHWALA